MSAASFNVSAGAGTTSSVAVAAAAAAAHSASTLSPSSGTGGQSASQLGHLGHGPGSTSLLNNSSHVVPSLASSTTNALLSSQVNATSDSSGPLFMPYEPPMSSSTMSHHSPSITTQACLSGIKSEAKDISEE